MYKSKHFVITGLLFSSVLLSGCTMPFSNSNKNQTSQISNSANSNSNNTNSNDNQLQQLIQQKVQTKLQQGQPGNQIDEVFTEIDENQHITDQQAQTLVNYFQNNHTDTDAGMFNQHTSLLVHVIAKQNAQDHTDTMKKPSQNLNQAILLANAQWQTFATDYRDQTNQLLYKRLTHGVNPRHQTTTVDFTPKIVKQALTQLFQLDNFASNPAIIKTKVDPLTGQNVHLNAKLARQYTKQWIKTVNNANNSVQQTKQQLQQSYQQALNDRNRLHLGTTDHLDNDYQRAITILNAHAALKMQPADAMKLTQASGDEQIVNLLSEQYHFSDPVLVKVLQQKMPFQRSTIQLIKTEQLLNLLKDPDYQAQLK